MCNGNSNYKLVKLINLSKLFTNVYKSLVFFILLNIILITYLYLKYFIFCLLLIQSFTKYLIIILKLYTSILV